MSRIFDNTVLDVFHLNLKSYVSEIEKLNSFLAVCSKLKKARGDGKILEMYRKYTSQIVSLSYLKCFLNVSLLFLGLL